MTATPDPSNMWGIFGLILIILLGMAFYLTISYFVRSYREAMNPQPKEIEEVEDDKPTV